MTEDMLARARLIVTDLDPPTVVRWDAYRAVAEALLAEREAREQAERERDDARRDGRLRLAAAEARAVEAEADSMEQAQIVARLGAQVDSITARAGRAERDHADAQDYITHLLARVAELEAALRDLADDVITRADARAALAGTFSQRESTEPPNFTESGKVAQQPVSTIADTTGLPDKNSSERCPTCGSDDRNEGWVLCRPIFGDPDPWHRATDTEGEK